VSAAPVPAAFAALIVMLAGLYLVALAAMAYVAPARATRFLGGFAQSPGRHYVELLLRLLAGSAFVLHAPRTRFSAAFTLFGWLLVITTLALLFLPWTWHQRFARHAVASAVRLLPLLAVAALALGLAILAAMTLGAA
jgi:hypothetical protein